MKTRFFRVRFRRKVGDVQSKLSLYTMASSSDEAHAIARKSSAGRYFTSVEIEEISRELYDAYTTSTNLFIKQWS